MNFNLESGKSRKINETPEVKVDSDKVSETEKNAENFDDCSLNEVHDSKKNEVNAESLEEAEEDYDDCKAKMNEIEEKNPELAEEDDFSDCGKETDGKYVAEVTYTTDGDISEEEAGAELQEAYNECDDPEDMQQLKENANGNVHIEVHNAEVVERPENSELGEEVAEEEYEEAKQELDEAQEKLEGQQEVAQEYQEDLENQINKHENEVSEGTENINNENSETIEETEKSNEVEETTEDSGGEEIGVEDLENKEDDSKIEPSEIGEENLSENVSQEVAEETDSELNDETKEPIAEEVSDEINSDAENNEISAAETEKIIEEKEAGAVDFLNEQSETMNEEIEQKVDEIAEKDALTKEEAKEQISEEVSKNTNENLSNDEMDAMVEESETIEETIEEKAEEQETVDFVKETTDELGDEKTEQFSEQAEQSLQERIDGAFEKKDVTASEINSLRDEHSAELQAKIEEKRTTEAEMKKKFDEVLSKKKGTDEYRQSLQEYNALQDKKVELDEQITTMEKQQDLLDKKSIELRDAQIQKGSEAMAASAATLAEVNMLQERYDQAYYDTKADKTELVNIRDESCSAIKELSVQKDSIEQAMDAKMDEISEYVTSNNMDRYDTAHDLRYQQMSAEYNAMKEKYDRIGYSIVKLDENNKAITERINSETRSKIETSARFFGAYAVDEYGFVKGDNFDHYIEDWENYSSNTHQTELFDEAKTHFISPSLIEGIRVSDYDIDNPSVFWSQHKSEGTEASFEEIARHIPMVESRLNACESLNELVQDPVVGECATIYFLPDNMPRVIKCGDYYEFQENGRHRILAARNIGYDIPVKVIGERTIKVADEVTDTTEIVDVFREKKRINDIVLPSVEIEMKKHIINNNLDKYISNDKLKEKITENTEALTPSEMKITYGDGWSSQIMGFNNADKSYIDSSYGDKQAKETAIHENFHQLSANDDKTLFGVVKTYKRGLSIDGNDRGINEALTQKYTLDTMCDTNPSYTNPACAYDDASKYIDDLYSFENNKDMFDQAYFKNNPDALRRHFDHYCGDGFFDELSKCFDVATDPDFSPSARKKSLDWIDKMVNDYKFNRLLS